MISLDEAIEIEERLACKLYEKWDKRDDPSSDLLYQWQAHEDIVSWLNKLKAIREYVDELRTFDQHNEYIDKIKEIVKWKTTN
nr:MAG TPA: hypothetical protein [Caudoviricetes sp.]